MSSPKSPVDGSAGDQGQGQDGQQQSAKMMSMPRSRPVNVPPTNQHRRGKAKCVAITDLIVGILSLLCLVLFVALSSLCLCISERETNPTLFNFVLVNCVLVLMLGVMEIYVSWILFKATRPATPLDQAIQKAECWQSCNVVLLVINFNYGCVSIASAQHIGSRLIYRIGGAYILCFFLRLLFIYLVTGFIKELERGEPPRMIGGNALISATP